MFRNVAKKVNRSFIGGEMVEASHVLTLGAKPLFWGRMVHLRIIRRLVFLAGVGLLTATAAQAAPMGSVASERGDGVVTLFRPVKQERQTFRYRTEDGRYDPAVFEEIAHFFRCRLTDEVHPIDEGLIEMLDAIEDHFGARELKLVSAYRSPLRNHVMRGRGRRVAKKSLHMEGRAADIEIDGVSPRRIRDFAYTLQGGGVGYYGSRRFVHVDTGPLRAWGWKPAARRVTRGTANK